jgi:GTP pyrophosphokinase
MRNLLDRKTTESGTPEGRAWIARQKKLLEKAEAYLYLEGKITERFRQEEISPLPRVEPRRAILGAALRRSLEGESLDELISRLGVRIYCHTIQDCYRVLGIVHSIGKPVAPKFSERFDDYIASPQPNGYQALHTAIIYTATGKGGKILIDFRI